MEGVHRLPARVQRDRRARHLCPPAAADVLPLNPQNLGAVSTHSAFNTAVSFTTNTNWQGYAGRVDYELPDPDGGVGLAQLRLRGRRHRRRAGARPRPDPAERRDDGQRARALRRRPGAFDRLRAASAQHRVRPGPGRERRHPELLPVRRGDHARGRQADHRDGTGRVARSPSSSWERTEAASSTPTARIRSKARRRSRTSSRCCSSSPFRRV